jgi:NAD(P)-dependent dehydrogenase (short-subunit alcohol dehydrogenase family)
MAFPPYTKVFHTASYPGIDPSRPDLSTAGKAVLITGGGSGIGPRIAHAFATSGCTKIAIVGRTVASLKKTKQELEGAHAGVTVHTATADIADETAVNKAFGSASKALGRIDIVISNAGYLPDTKPIAEADVEEWFKGMTINVKGTLNLAKAFLNYAAEEPTFVHVSTGGCHIDPMPANSAYAVSKLAAARLMEYFAFENPQVRVHNIHPGVVMTDMHKKSSEGGMDMEFQFDDSKFPGCLLPL